MQRLQPTNVRAHAKRVGLATVLTVLAGCGAGGGSDARSVQSPGQPMFAPMPIVTTASPAQPEAEAPVAWRAASMEPAATTKTTPQWVTTAADNALKTSQSSTEASGRPSYPAGDPDATLVDTLEGLTPATFAVEGADFDPRLTPDGKHLVFSSTQHRPTSDIYIKPVGSRTVTQLTADPANDVMPAVSPDGQRVAFCSDRNGSWQVFVMSIRGGRAVQLTSERTHDLHPSWSPDGKRLVFSRLGEVSGRWELWVVNVEQPASAEFIGYGIFPEWCPTPATGFAGSDRILFQRGRERGDRAFGLWTIDYKPGDASTPTEVVRAERGQAAINPAWSPDGQWIAYATVPATESGRPRAADLWITGVDGAGKVNLTSGRFANLMPCWGRDGRVYFVSDRSGSEAIWSVGTERALAAIRGVGNEARPVATAPAGSGD